MNSFLPARPSCFALLLLGFLALGGCQSPTDPLSLTDTFSSALTTGRLHYEKREQLAGDLARLDQICWFIIITRSQSTVASQASIVCKAKTGGVTDANAYAQGGTISEAAAIAILQIEEQVPSAGLQMGKAGEAAKLVASIAEIEQLAMRSWEFRLDKNNGWAALVNLRRDDELRNRIERAEHDSIEGAIRQALVQVRRSEVPLRN